MILHFDGKSWSTFSSGTNYQINDVWGTSPSDAWAVSHYGTILHFNGKRWSSVPSPANQPFYSVWGSSASDMWIAGLTGVFHGTPAP